MMNCLRTSKILLVSVFIALTCTSALAISADDFIPPVQAETAKRTELLSVKDEASVKTETDGNLDTEVTSAPTLQDAINKIVAQSKIGCQLVRLNGQDGITFVATGMGTYKSDYQNVLASRIEQRNAYVVAFMGAKAEMAKTVGELVVRGATDFDRKLEVLTTEKKTITNIERELTEVQCQWVRKVLKGYVTYSVSDDGNGKVYVAIVSTPKTRGNYGRNGANGISATNLHDGLSALIAEIKTGLVPPIGGRIIEVPATGEVAWVGFGSAIIRKDSEPDVQAELNLQAEQVAGLRAVDALAGIILGDDTSWQGHTDEQTTAQVKDFERIQRQDQSSRGTVEEIKEYEKRLRGMQNALSSSEEIKSLRKGIMPPGIIRQTDIDEDRYFAYGIAVYLPSASAQAKEASREMDEAQIVQPSQKNVPDMKMKRGPSGVVPQNL